MADSSNVIHLAMSNTKSVTTHSDGTVEIDTDRNDVAIRHRSNIVLYTHPDGAEPPAVITADDLADTLANTAGGSRCNVDRGVSYARSRASDLLPEDENGPACRRTYYRPHVEPFAKSYS